MIEKYGKARLDLSNWNGNNSLSAGDIETEILCRLKAGEDPLHILADDTRYPVLYNFSPERRNILDWYPFRKDMRVLEAGAGMGALTGMLCEKCGEVTALDPSRIRSEINAIRHKDKGNLTVCVCDFEDFNPGLKYDAVILIGAMEQAALFFGGRAPFQDMLGYLKNLLKDDGVLLLATENRYGIKYFSGAREGNNGLLYSGLEGYPDRHSAKHSERCVRSVVHFYDQTTVLQRCSRSSQPDRQIRTRVRCTPVY